MQEMTRVVFEHQLYRLQNPVGNKAKWKASNEYKQKCRNQPNLTKTKQNNKT
jgi:hypothetical protein